MAKTWYCTQGDHDKCDGTRIDGAPGPVTLGKCKCQCHKKGKSNV